MTVSLLCTVRQCGMPLARQGAQMLCRRGHAFDIARSGYCNLLGPQDKRSRTPGDTREAALARRRFLERGFFSALLPPMLALLDRQAAETLLDVGCGEGHYTGAFQRELRGETHGLDISTPAVDLAARRYKDCHFIVANADRFLPYADRSFSALVSITARLNPGEFHRVLRPDGRALLALPGPDDLIELRTAVLGEQQQIDRAPRALEQCAPLFTLQHRERVRVIEELREEDIRDVMTSSYRGLRHGQRERLEALRTCPVTFSRDLLLLRPRPVTS